MCKIVTIARLAIIGMIAALCNILHVQAQLNANAWIRVNQLGYTPTGNKVAILGSKQKITSSTFELINTATQQSIYKSKASTSFGKYGPFTETYRLDFSTFNTPGTYFLKAGEVISPVFSINARVYDGAADFCLRYMQQQRSGFNPFLNDSCHTHDGYTLQAPIADSSHLDVSGGWHDASDYLQYATTSANATWHLLAAARDFPSVFADTKLANGRNGKNNIPDVLDEAKWGLNWLLKMHPKEDWLFNQLGDDRDHKKMRIPKEDTNFYGKGLERPVYFCTGKPQVRGKFMNNTTGVASTAGKFAGAFALGSQVFAGTDKNYAGILQQKAASAWKMGLKQPGVCQTASVLSPYIYAEDNWTDDMELAAASIGEYELAYKYAAQEPITPWLGKDSAAHYQWYPFINIGHYELARNKSYQKRDTIIALYKEGINRVWQKAKRNAFYRGIPFIWCSNNLTTSFAIQCYWYRQLSGDHSFLPLEQACFDWLFGCNPWGTSMVFGLPAWGDTPVDPHSAFTHLKQYPIDGGLVDGPVYTSIYSNLIGIRLSKEDSYKDFQSDLAVYHDDYGDYSTNEPTMDGTASLIYLLAAQQAQANAAQPYTVAKGGIIRGNVTKKEVALVFTADEWAEGLSFIEQTLQQQKVKGAFFLTGRCYRNTAVTATIKKLYHNGHYMGMHSDAHLLYNDWNKRDSLLVTKELFANDLKRNREAMAALGITPREMPYYIPPYEWWNDSIAVWSRALGLQVISFTPGTGTNADYTYPEMKNYKSNETILQSVRQFHTASANGLNGAILLVHAGVNPRRTAPFYKSLNQFINWLTANGYACKRIDDLLH